MVTRGALVLFFTLSAGCGNYTRIKSPDSSRASLPAKAGLDFASVQSAVFVPYCVECHQQYRDYSGVRRELAAITGAVGNNRMPKGRGPLNSELKKQLQAWVAAGAPEKAGETEKPGSPVVLEPVWNSIRAEILAPKCLACHNPQGQAKFLDLSTRAAIFSARDRLFGEGEGTPLLDFIRPDKSYLIQVILDDVEPMPPAWSNIGRLNKEEVSVLQQWIGMGLP